MSSEEKRGALLPAALPPVVADHWRAGHSVIPMGADKVPLVRWKRYAEQPPTAGDLRYWCEEFGDRIRGWARVTGAVGGVIVLDFDGAAGVAWCEAWNLSPQVRTGSGGRHWIGKHPGWRVKTLNGKSAKDLGKRWPGVDIRGDGGYSLIAGYEAKGGYTWLRDPEPEELSVLPPEVAEYFGLLAAPALPPAQPVKPVAAKEVTRVTNANGGGSRPTPEQLFAVIAERWRGSGRNDVGFRLACQFRDNGYSQAECEAFPYWQYVGPTNTKGEIVPYDCGDWVKTVRSAFSGPERGPWARRGEGATHGEAKPAPRDEDAPVARAEPGTARLARPGSPAGGHREAVADGSQPPAASLLTEAQLTDLGNAYRLAERHGENLSYCDVWGDWMTWSGGPWRRDRTLEAQSLAQETIEAIYLAAWKHEDPERQKKLAAWALKSQSSSAVSACLTAAKSLTALKVIPEQFDQHPELLACANGTVSLQNGQLRPHRREDYLTQSCPVAYDPRALCPRFDRFLAEVMDGSAELVAYLWRAIGYSLTGWDDERCLFVCWGQGRNGKSTFLEVLKALVGDYGHKLRREALMARKVGPGQASPEIAGLRGKRFAYMSETEEGGRLDEGMIKELTGREQITARLLYGQEFTFLPTHKLWLSTNHKPTIRGTDDAIWDRPKLIPWAVRFGEAGRPLDRQLLPKLLTELPGILARGVGEAVAWRREGIADTPAVVAATSAYRREMDTIQAFLDECCDVGPLLSARAGALYQRFKRWADENNEFCPSQRKLAPRLEEKGFVQEKSTGGLFFWRGLDVKEEGAWMPREA